MDIAEDDMLRNSPRARQAVGSEGRNIGKWWFILGYVIDPQIGRE